MGAHVLEHRQGNIALYLIAFSQQIRKKRKTEYMWYPVSIGTNQGTWLVGNIVSLAHYFYFFF